MIDTWTKLRIVLDYCDASGRRDLGQIVLDALAEAKVLREEVEELRAELQTMMRRS